MKTKNEAVLKAAKDASQNAYAPYSQFKVGAALELRDGQIITGCNVENVSFGLSNCAERTAIYGAIAQGAALHQVKQIAIFTPTEQIHSPCGACRQVMAEFFDADTVFISSNNLSQRAWTVSELLPESFKF